MTLEELKNNIENLVANNSLVEVMDLIRSTIKDQEICQEAINLQARLAKLEKDINFGTIDKKDQDELKANNGIRNSEELKNYIIDLIAGSIQ